MPDERYARLKEMLEDHQRRLQQSLRVRLNEVRTHNHDGKVVEALDAADASASDLEQYFGMALAEMAAQALRQVDQALARLERGDYGLCMDCSEKISHKRLTALPFACGVASARNCAKSANGYGGPRQGATNHCRRSRDVCSASALTSGNRSGAL